MDQRLKDEVLSYSLVKQRIISQDDPTLSREVYVKHPEDFPKESGYVYTDSRFGFFDPLGKNWYLFNSDGILGDYGNIGFECASLPTHFSGGAFSLTHKVFILQQQRNQY